MLNIFFDLENVLVLRTRTAQNGVRDLKSIPESRD